MNARAANDHSAVERIERIVTLLTVFGPLLATAASIGLLWSHGVSWVEVTVCAALYVITVLGITLGYHRLFTHRSFRCRPWVAWALGSAGSMAAQGPVIYWVGTHRRHHQHSDDEADPHSPHFGGRHGGRAVLRGWWHAHVGWMLAPSRQNYFRYAGDLIRDPIAAAINRAYLPLVAAGLVLPGLLAWAWTHELASFFTGALWGGLVRLFLVHHVTWSINSVCHLFGAAPYATEDESRNNLWCAVLTLGEGWHNNHHAFPSSARHGLQWWQLDVSYLALRALRRLGCVTEVRLPAAAELAVRSKPRASPAPS